MLIPLDSIFPDWQSRAACKSYDPAVFFPKTESKFSTKKARDICASCPVKTKCLDWILEIEKREGSQIGGIYAGLDYRERRKLRRCLIDNCTNLARSTGGPHSKWSGRFCSDTCMAAYKKPVTNNPDNEYYMKGTIRGQGTAFS